MPSNSISPCLLRRAIQLGLMDKIVMVVSAAFGDGGSVFWLSALGCGVTALFVVDGAVAVVRPTQFP